MILTLGLLALVATPPSNALLLDRHAINVAGPSVEVWTDKDDDVMQRGDGVRVYFRASESGYVTVFRVDTDGRLRVLFPADPWEDNYARARQQYEVRPGGDRHSFVIDDYPGEGYVFAVVSRDPFDYGALVRGDHWDYRVMAETGRITGDPYVALTDLVDRIVPPNYTEYSYDVLPYFVEQHYQYPRFLCYECHSYASYPYWNPYSYSCFRFRIVIYDDFNYYPSRAYRGPRTIYRTAPRLAPRYVFKDRGQSEPFVTSVRERPVDQSGRRLLDPGVTVRDLGPSGRVPAPINGGRRPSSSSDAVGGNTGNHRGYDPQPNPGTNSGGAGRRTDPRDTPTRPNDGGNGQQSEGRRPSDQVIPPVPTGEPARPRLERRGEPESQPQRREDPQPETRQPEQRRQPESQPARQPDRPRVEPPPEQQQERPRVERQPDRQPDRPRVERQPEAQKQPEARPQPKASEPARRAEPRSAPDRKPVEKPKDPDENSGRRSN